MAKDSLIRTVCGGKVPREFKLAALLGDFFERLEKHYGVAEIADPDLKEKLTEDELQLLYAKFKYLDPNRVIPPMPTHGAIPFRNAVPVPVPPPPVPLRTEPINVGRPIVDEEVDYVNVHPVRANFATDEQLAAIITEPIQVETQKRGRKPKNK